MNLPNHKPYSESCDQNRDPILQSLTPTLAARTQVLEIGSGTGQHAVYFGQHLAHLTWQTSDVVEYHAGILAWLRDAALPNVKAPLALDVRMDPWPMIDGVDAVFSANTAHIMSWPAAQRMVQQVAMLLPTDGLFILYGPFNYHGQFTSASNQRFDQWLKARDPNSGVRDFEALQKIAHAHQLVLDEDHEMPANNRTLVWRKQA